DRATGGSAIIQETYARDFPALLCLNRTAKREEQSAKRKSIDVSSHKFPRVLQIPAPCSLLFDNFIRSHQHVWRNRYADLLRRFQIDDQLKLTGCSTGRSAGLVPLRILSTYVAARRYKS